ncbi:MAG: DUF503 domain-containing protein [Anaerolineae bacterium]
MRNLRQIFMTKVIGLCTLTLHLPESTSLKHKRSTVKSILAKLHNKFNVSAAETDHLDKWQLAEIAFALVSNSTSHANQVIFTAMEWVEVNYPEALITKHDIEIL